MNLIKSYARVLQYVLLLQVLCMFVLTLCRIVLCVTNLPVEGLDWSLLPKAMLNGMRFDALIVCYVSAIPIVFVPVWALCTLRHERYDAWMQKVTCGVVWYYAITYALLIFVHIANARYYTFFENHLNIGVTAWFGFVGDTAGLLFGDSVNWWFLLGAILLIVLYDMALVAITRQYANGWKPAQEANTKQYVSAVLLTVLLWGVTFCGMRGSVQRYPLRISFAYFCGKPFYNKLGINPVFNIIKSTEYETIQIPEVIASIDEHEAIAYVQREMGIQHIDSLRPIVREGSVNRMVEGKPNIVLIFMESMATENLERKGTSGEWLTPYLRSLRDKSIYWANCYSSGIHTNNGIVGIHYGFVPNFAKPIMNANADYYTGLPYYLQKNGYSTMCFITGNPQYDNMNTFWWDNHIEDIYSLDDYDVSAAVNNFGVSDTYLFEWGLRKLEERSKEDKPFFASFLTISNHAPYVIPEEYVGRSENIRDQGIAYADGALEQFVEKAKQTEWGKNTIFVLVADHGAAYIPHVQYEMPLSYNHVPVYFYSDLLTPQRIDRPASQIDIWESVLSMLCIPYENNCLGVDLFTQSRRYAFFVNDDQLGVCDGEYFWCYGINSQREHLYRIDDVTDILQDEPERAAQMRAFGMNMQRVNLLAIEKKWTEPSK